MTGLLWQFALILELLGDPKGKVTVMGGGIHSRVAQKAFVTIQNADDVDRFLEVLGPAASDLALMPRLDLKMRTGIAAFLGERFSKGYTLRLSGVDETAREFRLTFREIQPGATCLKSQTLTHPYLLISIPKTSKQIHSEFESEVDVIECN